jgi:glycosyltransferase involved in cell wall biosynthesis
MKNEPKIAIICDWLTNLGGAERVILDMYDAFPNADIYTSIYNPRALPQFKKAKIHTSFLQNFPLAQTKHYLYLPLMPQAFESFDLSKYDIVLSSAFACAKGVITKPETIHICYCHTPMRYVWDQSHGYINSHGLNSMIKKGGKLFLHKLRLWDKLASERVDKYIANSQYISRKIQKYYNAESDIIHPGVSFDKPDLSKNKREDFYLAAGRLKAYKKFELIIEAFNKSKRTLYIAGRGEHEKYLKSINTNPNTHFLGFVEEEVLKNMYKKAKGFIFPQCEDFGITPIEAQNFGCPVIAFKKGGVTETVKANKTGIFFKKQTVKALNDAIKKGESINWDQLAIQEHAQKFSSKRFKKELKEYVQKANSDYRS